MKTLFKVIIFTGGFLLGQHAQAAAQTGVDEKTFGMHQSAVVSVANVYDHLQAAVTKNDVKSVQALVATKEFEKLSEVEHLLLVDDAFQAKKYLCGYFILAKLMILLNSQPQTYAAQRNALEERWKVYFVNNAEIRGCIFYQSISASITNKEDFLTYMIADGHVTPVQAMDTFCAFLCKELDPRGSPLLQQVLAKNNIWTKEQWLVVINYCQTKATPHVRDMFLNKRYFRKICQLTGVNAWN